MNIWMYTVKPKPVVFHHTAHMIVLSSIHCTCIDYRGLNLVTVKYPYPLGPSTIEQLRSTKIFTLNINVRKISFLGYVIDTERLAMDIEKLETISEWPVPKTVKELQQFLNFVNFYRWIIRGFSSIAAPVTFLLKDNAKKLK